MWIEKTPGGKYKACERYTDPLTGKEKKVTVTMYRNNASTRKAALQTLTDKIAKKITPVCASRDMTVSALIELYLKRIKAVIRWGYRNEYVESISYLDRIERFRDATAREKIQDKYLESEELKAIISSMTLQKWKDFTLFLTLTGMRVGEALALTIDDVNLADREIRINKTYDSNNKVTTPPKTLDSFREIYIQDELLPLVKKLRQSTLAYKFVTKATCSFKTRMDGLIIILTGNICAYIARKSWEGNAHHIS